MNNFLVFEALDRIHSIQTMLSSLLSHGEDFHTGLSEEAKIHVDNAMDCLYRAYQAQGEYLDEQDGDEFSASQPTPRVVLSEETLERMSKIDITELMSVGDLSCGKDNRDSSYTEVAGFGIFKELGMSDIDGLEYQKEMRE